MDRPNRRLNLEGQTFGFLTALRDVNSHKGHRVWECKCVCGKLHKVIANKLRNGHTRSCGCKRIELFSRTLHPRWGGGKNNKGSLSWARNKILESTKSALRKDYHPPSIDAETLVNLYMSHNKRCDICGVPENELTLGLCLDHCHRTGSVRGFLCNSCNLAIGFLKDDKKLLENAVRYLDNAGTLTKSAG